MRHVKLIKLNTEIIKYERKNKFMAKCLKTRANVLLKFGRLQKCF